MVSGTEDRDKIYDRVLARAEFGSCIRTDFSSGGVSFEISMGRDVEKMSDECYDCFLSSRATF